MAFPTRLDMVIRAGWLVLACGLVLADPLRADAGMPSPLPANPARTLRLGDTALARLQAISFFLLVFFLCAAVVQLAWNSFRRDFPRLPRLGYGRAVAGVFLWGLLFVIVLTMISGARELMTPGAWRKQGFTYALADAPPRPVHPDPEAARRQSLETLRTELLRYAATHGGHYPAPKDLSAIPAALWETPAGGGLRYLYVPGRTAGQQPPVVLAYEPELDPSRRLVLRTDGEIVVMTSAQLHELNPAGAMP